MKQLTEMSHEQEDQFKMVGDDIVEISEPETGIVIQMELVSEVRSGGPRRPTPRSVLQRSSRKRWRRSRTSNCLCMTKPRRPRTQNES